MLDTMQFQTCMQEVVTLTVLHETYSQFLLKFFSVLFAFHGILVNNFFNNVEYARNFEILKRKYFCLYSKMHIELLFVVLLFDYKFCFHFS